MGGKIVEDKMKKQMPILFISHGPPFLAVADQPAGKFWDGLGNNLPNPRAILCISAHWESVRPMITSADHPETVHDFSGPPSLFSLEYAVRGDPELADRIAGILGNRGFDAVCDARRGLDHGVWVPLMRIFPAGDIPVLQLSVQSEENPLHHYEVGKALMPLREEGLMIIGSGGATHNLGEIGEYGIHDAPADYALAFDDWLFNAVTTGNTEELLDYKKTGPFAEENHPYPAEHLLPFFVPLGAAGEKSAGRCLFRGFLYGVLSMAAYVWE